MASDLPETGFESSAQMARVLVTYMDCPHVIRARLREDFHSPPTLSTIRRYRNEYLASLEKVPQAPHKPHEGYYPADQSERLALINKRFLAALEREREISALWAISCGVLDSPALSQPALVDKAWEREIAAAKREADL